MMKCMLATALALGSVAGAAVPVAAQEADAAAITAQRSAMQRFAWMHGTWRGTASGMARTGPYRIVHTERVGPMLDGTLLVIEGRSFDDKGDTPFHAFAVLSFDAATGKYSMRSHALGRAGDFPLTPTDAGYDWAVPAGPNARIAYSARFDGTIWTETGDYLAEGQPARRIFQMTLKRVGNTGWPAEGGVPRD